MNETSVFVLAELVTAQILEFKLHVNIDEQIISVIVMALEVARWKHDEVVWVLLDSKIEGDSRPPLATCEHTSQTRLFLSRFTVHVSVVVRLRP